jgi:uncharacterized protein (DUF2141 family)
MRSLCSANKGPWGFRFPKVMQLLGSTMAVLLVCLPMYSQDLGRLTETITDQSDGVIAGATVTDKDMERGVSRTLTTGDSGEYNAPNLLPGSYAVRAEAKGFQAVSGPQLLQKAMVCLPSESC